MTRGSGTDRQQYDAFRKAVLELVTAYAIPQKELAEYAHRSQPLMSRILKGHEVSLPTLERLALSIQALLKPSDRERLKRHLVRIQRDGRDGR